jgi:hypothetical protein
MKAIEILKTILKYNEKSIYSKKHIDEAIKELEELQEKVKVQDDLLKQYVKKEFDGVVAEIGEVCTNCDNYLKDRTIFYDCKKVMICNFCKFNNVSYFKEKTKSYCE